MPFDLRSGHPELRRGVKHAVLGIALAAMLCASMPADAQWLKTKTPGIPRTKDGKPNLTAPAPKGPNGKPDLSGIWRAEPGGYFLDLTSDLKPEEDPAVGSGAGEGARRAVQHRSPVVPLHARDRTDLQLRPVQVPSQRRHARDVARRWTASSDSDRWPCAARRSAADVDGLLSGPLGRQHDGRRERRLQRSHMARLRRTSSHRSAAYNRAFHAQGFRAHGRFRLRSTIRRRTRGRGRSRCTPS